MKPALIKAIYSFFYMRHFAIALFLLFASASTFARDFPMIHYSMKDGLPSNTVYEVYQDSKGFLWFGTDKGVARYNGIKFETFTTFDGLPDNDMFFFQEDYEGRMWMASYNGQLSYYKNGKFYNASNTPFLKLPFVPFHICDIRLEQDSSITINFRSFHNFINIYKNTLRIYNHETINKKISPDSGPIDVKRNGRKGYTIIYPEHIADVDTHMNIISHRKLPTVVQYYFLRSINPRVNTYYLAGANDSVYSDDMQFLFPLKKNIRQKNSLIRILKDSSNLFLGTDHGLFINNNIHLFADQEVGGMSKDKEGNYWICVIDKGVYKLSHEFLNTQVISNVYESPVVYGHRDRDYIFFNNRKKNVYRIKDTVPECIFNYERQTGKQPKYAFDGYSWYRDNIILTSNYGNFIIKGIRNEHPRVMPSGIRNWGEWEVFLTDSLAYVKNLGLTIFYARKKDLASNKDSVLFYLWTHAKKYPDLVRVTTGSTWYTPIDKFTEPYDSLVYYRLDRDEPFLIKKMAIAYDDSGYIWYANTSGVYKIIKRKAERQKQFGSLFFKSFLFAGHYLIGTTHDHKQLICNLQGGKVYIEYIKENVLWDRFQKLNDSTILISTDNLFRILILHPSQAKPLYSFDYIENPFVPAPVEYFCAKDSLCYFFKEGSITIIPTRELLKKPAGPELKFSTLRTLKKQSDIDSAIELPFYEARNINIAFSVLSLNNKNIAYEYSISRKEEADEWHQMKGEDINLYKIGYGSYLVKIRAKKQSGIYTIPRVLKLTVLRPFWAQWWFIMSCIVVFGLLTWFSIRYTIKVTTQKKEKEIKFLRSEYKALNALMNPHFIFNALNSIQGLVNSNNKIQASEYIRTFSNLIRQNMQNISRELIPLEKEINLVINYLMLEKLRFNDHLNYNIDIDDELDLDRVMIPPLIIQPIVENAVKHGLWPRESTDNLINLRVYEKGNQLCVEITDNGVGLHHKSRRDPQHESLGLKSIDERLEKLSVIHNINILFDIHEMKDSDGQVTGTKALIIIDYI